MKTLFLFSIIFTLATTSFAQGSAQPKKKMTNPPTSTPVVYTSPIETELTVLLGAASGAANIGVDYARMNNNLGYGGYFFLQTEKTSVPVSQIMSFGGFIKINIFDSSKATVFVSPGFGIHMIKGISPLSDETAFGPAFKYGAQYKLTPNFALGLERSAFVNLFNDKAAASLELISFAGSFNF